MTNDDEFTPRLGRIRSGRSRERSYLHRVLQGVVRAGVSATRKSRFNGSRIGRGSGAGRVLRSRDQYAAFRSRRVIIQTRIVKLAARGLKGARRHLRYIQRDGVTREGSAGALYDRENDKADGRAFIDRAEGDRHQFRFIVSAEDGEEYQDLKPVIRRLMDRVEDDLGTKLDWVAADHYNTGHPHSHVILRGKDDTGHDLIIAREYITHGMRERACEIVSLDLGPRSDFEVQGRMRNEIDQERFTSLDRDLLRAAREDGLVTTAHSDAFRQTLRAGRLQKLQRLGLAEEIEPGQWHLAQDLRITLQRLGERGDIIKTMHRELARDGRVHSPADYAIYDPADVRTAKLVGRVAAHGLSDELNERHYVIIEGVDGRSHYVDLGLADGSELPPEGGIVAIAPRVSGAKNADRVIAEIAAAHDGHYSAEIHMHHDPSATPEFVQAHVRRLEALRLAGVGIERTPDGLWSVAPDHLHRVERYEGAQRGARPVQVEVLSAWPIERQIAANGATWLDRELVATTPTELRAQGFGGDAREALDRRRQWLIAESLAREEQDRTIYAAGLISQLRQRDLARAGAQLSSELNLAYVPAAPGERVEGLYKRHTDLASGRFAIIEKSREFTLVPWRPVLEQNLGKQVSGVLRGETISWTIGRQRSGPSIS
ncbi:MAG TPA: relaxase/mobilization nuclease RlxS [Rhizomicrobium sp.]